MARYTPAEYDDLLASYGTDPPVDELLRLTNELLSELLARYHNVHFHDPASSDPPLRGGDFLRNRNARDAEDEDEPIEDEDGAGEPLHPMRQPGMRAGIAGVRGTGAVVPDAIMGLFGGGEG